MVFKGIIDSITRARAYYLYLCEHLPACVKFLLRVSIELHMRKLIRGVLPRRRVKEVAITR